MFDSKRTRLLESSKLFHVTPGDQRRDFASRQVPSKEASAMPNLDILKRRIARVAARVLPGCQVVFEATPFAWVRFRIEDRSGQTIAGPSADFHAEEIADWTDQELRDVL